MTTDQIAFDTKLPYGYHSKRMNHRLTIITLIFCFPSSLTFSIVPKKEYLGKLNKIPVLVNDMPLIKTPSTNSGIDIPSRRRVLRNGIFPTVLASIFTFRGSKIGLAAGSYPTIDVNNAMAREFTAFPGLYPTIATKIVNAAKKTPFNSKKDVYAALDTDLERERLKQYDSSIQISKPDASLKQFKASQICKYECGSRVSSDFRNEMIKSVQKDRMGI